MPSQPTYTNANVATTPAFDGFAITPSDTQTFLQQGGQAPYCRAIYVGVAGNISIVTVGGTTLVFLNCVQGSILPVCAKQVTAANTTATNLIALI